ncbi:MAG: esterase-like activity of phytase family protein [Candidatus Parabeggiatoa sp. nov. 1]|nr:MAG: esterase-like activity of phytase family protein [Gammaproteobacteria bacterium]
MILKFIKTLALLIWLVTLTACMTITRPVTFSDQYQVGDAYMKIRLQGTVELANDEINGIPLTELSGLVWDEDEKRLYALSDNGSLFHLRPIINNNTLTDIKVLYAYWLLNNKGERLQSRDSEGLAILNGNNGVAGDTELVISFERQPRVARFSPQGTPLGDYTLPAPLQNIENYYSSNKALEAVTVHPRLGILLAPEWPLKQKNQEYSLKGQHKHTIYTLNNQQWTFPAYPAPNSAVVALEALADGSVLVLERAFVSVFQPFIISLRQVWLSTGKNGSTNVKYQQVAVLDSSEGWEIDNFEGLTHHQNTFFIMVSDDNNSSLQSTLLSYWELGNW